MGMRLPGATAEQHAHEQAYARRDGHGLIGILADGHVGVFGPGDDLLAGAFIELAKAFLGGVGSLDPDLVRAGFAAVTSPGRLEVVRRSPTVIVDAAHNPHGARALARLMGR